MNVRDQFQRQISRAMAAVRQAFRGQLGRVRSDTPIQLVALDSLAGESLRDVELFQHFGFTSVPPEKSEGIAVPVGGRTSHSIIIATENGVFRLTGLKSGESAIYSDEGAKIVIKKGRLIEATCDTFRVICKNYDVQATVGATFDTPTLSASDEVVAGDKITGQGGLAISGGDGAHVEGSLHATDDVSAGNISLNGHHHDGVHGPTGSALP